jgi:uncharacterized membrane protein YjjB (DUF3815 family)
VATAIPYLLGFFTQNSDWVFSGFVFGVEDGNSYTAKMLGGSAGDWLFYTPYTAYPQQGVIAFLPYILLGKLAFPPARHDQLIALFQIFRIAGVFASVLATYRFAAVFLIDVKARRAATILIAMGGGLGWLSVVGLGSLWQNRIPLEFYSPETFGFLGIYGLPHLAFGRAFLLFGFTNYLRLDGTESLKEKLLTGLAWIGLGLMQPLTVVIGWAIILTHQGLLWGLNSWRVRRFKQLPEITWTLAIPFLAPSLLIAYTAASFALNPFLRGWTAQNLIISPPFTDYLLAFGVVLPFAIAACVDFVRRKDRMGLFLTGWVILLPFLAYAPYNLQRRLPEGIWVALVVLALIKINSIKLAFRRTAFAFLYSGLLCSLMLLVGSLGVTTSPAIPIFRPAGEVAMFNFVAQTARRDAVVLASFDTSNALPAWAPVRTVIGHGPESIHSDLLMPRVTEFYAGQLDEEPSLISEFNVQYVIYGPAEKALGTWAPFGNNRFTLIYDKDEYKVFKVVQN